ncbi:MAG: hypothetical protein ACK5Q5_05900 [Planctomycetaceae bacterium]
MSPSVDQSPESLLPTNGQLDLRRAALAKSARKFLWGMCLMLLCLFSLLVMLQRKLIYRPTREPVTRASVGFATERISDVVIRTQDGLDLQGWLVAANSAASTRAGSSPG